MVKGVTHKGFFFRSMLQGQFAGIKHSEEHSLGACSLLYSTPEGASSSLFNLPLGSCSNIFHQFNGMEHFGR